MYLKLFGFGIAFFGLFLIYLNRHIEDDSLLLGSVLILTGVVLFTIKWIVRLDSNRDSFW